LSARDGKPKRLTPGAAARLLAYSWPGNVREIKNVVERANVMVRGDDIDETNIEVAIPMQAAQSALSTEWTDKDMPAAVAKLEKEMIARALEACGGNRTEAAQRLKINRQLLYAKMQRYGLAEKSSSEIPTQGVEKPDSDTPGD